MSPIGGQEEFATTTRHGFEDPPLRTIFEVYASLALGTHGEFNVFETH